MSMTAATRNAFRAGTVLLLFALVGTAMLAFTHDRTEPVITRSQQAEKLALINQVLPASSYDNDLLASRQDLPPDDLLGTRQPSALWIARHGSQVTAVVLEAIAPDGYAGDIALLIGIDIDGKVTGVRVTAHRETPGLGGEIANPTWQALWRGRKAYDANWDVGIQVIKGQAGPPETDPLHVDGLSGSTVTSKAITQLVRFWLGDNGYGKFLKKFREGAPA